MTTPSTLPTPTTTLPDISGGQKQIIIFSLDDAMCGHELDQQLSIGCKVAILVRPEHWLADKQKYDLYYANIKLGMAQDHEYFQENWKENLHAYKRTTRDPLPGISSAVHLDFAEWVERQLAFHPTAIPVLLANPWEGAGLRLWQNFERFNLNWPFKVVLDLQKTLRARNPGDTFEEQWQDMSERNPFIGEADLDAATQARLFLHFMGVTNVELVTRRGRLGQH